MISLLVRVSYRDPKREYPQVTHYVVNVDDTSPVREIPRAVRRTVEEWARDLHYIPVDWSIKSVNLGRSDYFAGTF